MKHLFIVLVAILIAVPCFSAGLNSSSEKTADGIIRSSEGTYGGMIIHTDGSNNCKVVIYDNASTNTGWVLDEGSCVAADLTCKYLFPWPVPAKKGVYADMTVGGGTCTFIIYTGDK